MSIRSTVLRAASIDTITVRLDQRSTPPAAERESFGRLYLAGNSVLRIYKVRRSCCLVSRPTNRKLQLTVSIFTLAVFSYEVRTSKQLDNILLRRVLCILVHRHYSIGDTEKEVMILQMDPKLLAAFGREKVSVYSAHECGQQVVRT